ncbi:MAG TPA: hypothetical protein VE130_13490 [Nitrososphaeraceae archaeon]|nr:hypothetical protein [Nitrososphaeraceae archaeon]
MDTPVFYPSKNEEDIVPDPRVKIGSIRVPGLTLNWHKICNSRVLVVTRDGLTCGNAVDEFNDSIVLIEFSASRWREYLVPKTAVERYDGDMLHLNIHHEILTRYAY